jgi:hypothetical protein
MDDDLSEGSVAVVDVDDVVEDFEGREDELLRREKVFLRRSRNAMTSKRQSRFRNTVGELVNELYNNRETSSKVEKAQL